MKTPHLENSILGFCAVHECIFLLLPNKLIFFWFRAVRWLCVQFPAAQECPLLEWIWDSCSTDRTTKWPPQQKLNNFVLLCNHVFLTHKLSSFVRWEIQPILFRAALNKIKHFWAAWEMLFFIWAAH